MSDDSAGLMLFDTAIGRCGVAWRGARLVAVQLPEADDDITRSRLRRKVGGEAEEGAPPPAIKRVIDDCIALLDGEARDFAQADLELETVTAFNRQVYDVALAIPPGGTLTYGEVAARIGEPGAARAVGKALGENPWPIVVPCHRVLAADGKTGGFSANGGVETKLKMLSIERVHKVGAPTLFDDDPAFDYAARR